MTQTDAKKKSPRLAMGAAICLVVAVLYFAREVFIPLALAALMSFLLAPMVKRLERLRLPRPAAVLMTVAIAFAIIGLIGYAVGNQVADLARDIPQYRENIQKKISSLRRQTGVWGEVATTIKDIRRIGDGTTQPAQTGASASTSTDELESSRPMVVQQQESSSSTTSLIETLVEAVLSPLGTGFIVVVFSIFILLQREELRDRILRLAGRGQLTVTTEALEDAAGRVSRYLMMQTLINGSVGIAVTAGLWFIGVPNPVLWGLIAAVLRFIPYIGIWVAAGATALFCLAVKDEFRFTLESAGLFVGIEAIAANVLEPWLFGSSTGIATLAILVSAAFWAWLWGPIGLLLSTPLTVCVVVLGKYVPQLEFLTILLGDQPALDPPARIYQRLVALDQEEAAQIAGEYRRQMSLEDLYDTVLVPALVIAQQEARRGMVDSKRFGRIRKGLLEIVQQLGEQQRQANIRAVTQQTVELARAGDPGTLNAAELMPTPVVVPADCTVNIACIPSHDETDEVSSVMLAQLLELRGYCAHAVPVAALASEILDIVEREKADAICLCALPPGALSHARYLGKRLLSRFPQLPLVVGLWLGERDMPRASRQISGIGPVKLAVDFRQALVLIRDIVQGKLINVDQGNAESAHPLPVA